MRILITNDDGYLAPGMRCALEVVRIMGAEPIIVAPTHGVSGASRSRESGKTMEWGRATVAGEEGIQLDGPPAACVLFAMTSDIVGPVDLCLSGVNAGENLGSELTISGTFGAALEANSFGIPSISISRQYGDDIHSDPNHWDWSEIAERAANAIKWCLQRTPPWSLANINLPNHPSVLEPIATKVSNRQYFKSVYDLQTNKIVSELEGAWDELEADCDIMQFAIEHRISATFWNSSIASHIG
jgi:5'-nucleotidase